LAPHVQEVALELRYVLQQAHPVVRPRPLARPRHLAAADQAHIRNALVGGAEGPRHDQRYAGAGEAGDAGVTPALSEGQRVSSRPGRFHPHRQRHQLMQIN
jgi:hypothetical protein